MAEPKEQPAKKSYISKVVLPIAASLILIPALWFGVHTNAFKLATTRQPEPFTELYFVKPEALPRQIDAGKAYTQSFAIANHENQTVTYTYQVSVTDANGVKTDTPVKVNIASASTVTRSFTYTEPTANQPDVLITVTLINKNQNIQFHVKS